MSNSYSKIIKIQDCKTTFNKAVEMTLEELGWRHIKVSLDTYEAKKSFGWQSAGENIFVEVQDDESFSILSKSSLPTVKYDMGINQKNVEKFELVFWKITNRLLEEEKVCPMCMETIKKGAKICRYCGNKFE